MRYLVALLIGVVLLAGCDFPPDGRQTPIAFENRTGTDVIVGDPDNDHGTYRIPEGRQYNTTWAGGQGIFKSEVYEHDGGDPRRLGCVSALVEPKTTARGVIVLDDKSITDGACKDETASTGIEYCAAVSPEKDEDFIGLADELDCRQ